MTAKRALLMILLFLVLAASSSAQGSPGLTAGIQTDRTWYFLGENINVFGEVLYDEAPLVSANVALEIHDSSDSPVITRTLQTNSTGFYNLAFKLSSEALMGDYVAYVSCTHNGHTALNSTSFQLRQPSALVLLLTTDKQTYIISDNITITGSATLDGVKQPQVLVALEVQNPSGIPIIVRVLETDSQGGYNLTFPATSELPTGNYTGYASAIYNGSSARTTASFELKPQMSSADINKDGKVNIVDLTLVAKAWGSYPGHERWDARCDVNGDGKVNIMDLTLVAKEYKS